MSTSLKQMRGWGALAVLVAGTFALTGCNAANTAGEDAAQQSVAPAASAAPAETDAADNGNLTVVVTEAALVDGKIETRAIVTGHIGAGTCVATATSASGETLTAEVAAVPDAQSTSCPLMALEGAEAGDWQVDVAFTGEGVSGQSEAIPAEVL